MALTFAQTLTYIINSFIILLTDIIDNKHLKRAFYLLTKAYDNHLDIKCFQKTREQFSNWGDIWCPASLEAQHKIAAAQHPGKCVCYTVHTVKGCEKHNQIQNIVSGGRINSVSENYNQVFEMEIRIYYNWRRVKFAWPVDY